MTTQDLLKKLKEQDPEALDQVYEKYGWELHAYLSQNRPGREDNSRIFRKAIHRFCADLQSYSGNDPLEAALFMYARQAAEEPDDGMDEVFPEESTQEFPAAPAPEAPKKRRRGGRLLLTLLLLVLALAGVWVILGQVIRLGLFPGFAPDLGYRWFNQFVAPWF